MSVLRRNMFRGGGYAHRGTGITSGLVPVQKFQEGGMSKWEALSPWLMDIGGRLMGGTSMTGNPWEIAGSAMTGAAPTLSEGLKTYRESKKTDDERYEFKVVGNKLIRIDNELGTTEVVEEYEKPEDQYMIVKKDERVLERTDDGLVPVINEVKVEKDKKFYTLAPNTRLVDPNDGRIVAEGKPNDPNTIYKLNPGQKAFKMENGELVEVAHYPDTSDGSSIIKLSSGAQAFDSDGNLIASNAAVKTITLGPGEIAYDLNGNQIAANTEEKSKIFKLKPGESAYTQDGVEIAFKEVVPKDDKIFKLKPGESAFNSAGEVIASLPESEVKKLQFKVLKPGDLLYDTEGNLIANAPSIDEIADTYHNFKTKDERFLWKLKQYEKKAGYKDDGTLDLDKLNDLERADYNRILPLVDPKAAEDIKVWSNFKEQQLADLSFISGMGERISLAKELFDKNQATGAVRGRLTPLFNVFLDVTGLSIPQIINDTFGKDILLEELTANEIKRLQSAVAISFQEAMKGQVNTFEQKLILNAMFNVTRDPESAALAFDNLIYMNDLKKQMIYEAQRSNNYIEWTNNIEKWKKENKPSFLKTDAEELDDLMGKYGIELDPKKY